MKMVLHIDMTKAKNKKAIQQAIKKKWSLAIRRSAIELQRRLPKLLVDGGGEFRGFKSTTLWKFLNTQRAWGELGFPDIQPLDDLLQGLLNSILIKATKGRSAKLILKFVDLQIVGMFTEHPAAGQGQLKTGLSWFVDWIVKGKPVSKYRFIRTQGKGNPRSMMIAGREAGLMVGGGMWDFPPIFRTALQDWLLMNLPFIKKFVYSTIKKTIKKV